MKRTFKKDALLLVSCEEIKTPEDEFGPLVWVENGEWGDEGKYQHQLIVFQTIDDGKFWGYWLSRSGSYFTDYWYSWEDEKDEIELHEIAKVTKTIEIWEGVE